MAAKVAKGAIRKSKPVVTKTSLTSPYEKIWTHVSGEDMQQILRTLTDKFIELGLKKVEIRKKLVKKGKKSKEHSEDGAKPESQKEKQPIEEPPTEGLVTSGWTHSEVRKHLAIGVNEVTRALERDDARLVIVCKSAKPEMITKHIIELSASREVPACQLPRLSENVAPVLGLKSVLALGFRKSSDIFLEQVKAIAPLVPPLHVPWLGGKSEKTEEEPEQEAQPEGDDGKEVAATRKRKHPTSERTGGAELQALKVKKIVPNPNKKRKTKLKNKK